MKLVVGLGNPGKEYQQTRHNIGWDVVSLVAKQCAAGRSKVKFEGELVEIAIASERTLLLLPHTYMNASGRSVRKACDYYQIPAENLLVICDDFQLSTGRLRMRAEGSAGGQKGLQDIIQQLGSEKWSRLRFGIGQPPPRWNTRDYVLGRFTKEELGLVKEAAQRAAEAVADWVQHGTEFCMNKYNADPHTETGEQT